MIELYFSTVKTLTQRPTRISAVAAVLLITKTERERARAGWLDTERERELASWRERESWLERVRERELAGEK